MSYTESARYTFSNRQSQPLARSLCFTPSWKRSFCRISIPDLTSHPLGRYWCWRCHSCQHIFLCIRIRKSHSQVHIVDRPINADGGRGRSRGDVRKERKNVRVWTRTVSSFHFPVLSQWECFETGTNDSEEQCILYMNSRRRGPYIQTTEWNLQVSPAPSTGGR